MCGRFGRTTQTHVFARQLGLLDEHPSLAQSYNIAPGRWILAAADDPLDRSKTCMQSIYWGFVPSWADKASRAQINARSETADKKPFFRKAFRHRRCVLASDFWVEWARNGDHKQPYVIRPRDGQPFFFAGVWSLAKSLPEDHAAANLRTAAILTAPALPDIKHIHPRMPIALTPVGAKAWLTPENSGSSSGLKKRLATGRHTEFESWPVSTRVNKPSNDDKTLLEPL